MQGNVVNGAYLAGVVTGAVAGGLIVGVGYLAVTGLKAAARLFAKDAQKRLAAPDEPVVDMDSIFDQLGVQKESHGQKFLASISQEDSNKILDLLSGERRDGVDYKNFRLFKGEDPILETNEVGEIINNQFENPLADSRIVSALQAALQNRSNGIPVGSQKLTDMGADIPNIGIQDLVTRVADEMASVAANQNPNPVAERLAKEPEIINPQDLSNAEGELFATQSQSEFDEIDVPSIEYGELPGFTEELGRSDSSDGLPQIIAEPEFETLSETGSPPIFYPGFGGDGNDPELEAVVETVRPPIFYPGFGGADKDLEPTNAPEPLESPQTFDFLPITQTDPEVPQNDTKPRVPSAAMVKDLMTIGDHISEQVYNGEQVSILRSSVPGREDAYKLSVIATPSVTINAGENESTLVDQEGQPLGVIPNDSKVFLPNPNVDIRESRTAAGNGLVAETLTDGKTGAVLMEIIVEGENNISINTADISSDIEKKLAIELGTAAKSLSNGKAISGALAPARNVDQKVQVTANTIQHSLHCLRDYENGEHESAVDRLNAISREKLNGAYKFEYSASSKKKSIICLKDGTTVCKFSSKAFKREGTAKDKETSQALAAGFAQDLEGAGIATALDTPEVAQSLEETPQVSDRVQVIRPVKDQSPSQTLTR